MKNLVRTIKFKWVILLIVGINILVVITPFLLGPVLNKIGSWDTMERIRMEADASRVFLNLMKGVLWVDGIAAILGVGMMVLDLFFIVFKRSLRNGLIGKGSLLFVVSGVLCFVVLMVLSIYNSPFDIVLPTLVK